MSSPRSVTEVHVSMVQWSTSFRHATEQCGTNSFTGEFRLQQWPLHF